MVGIPWRHQQVARRITLHGAFVDLPKSRNGPFFPATNADYDSVREYVARFEREVRPVEER